MKNLVELVNTIDKLFKNKKKEKYSIIQWSLIKWQNGYWSVRVTDDWHKWINAGIKENGFLYSTPEMACEKFIEFVKKNKINIKKLQSK